MLMCTLKKNRQTITFMGKVYMCPHGHKLSSQENKNFNYINTFYLQEDQETHFLIYLYHQNFVSFVALIYAFRAYIKTT